MRMPGFRHSPDPAADTSTWGDGDERLAAVLDWYAESLSPDNAALSRIGAAVRAAFVESLTETEAGLHWVAGAFGTGPGDRSLETGAPWTGKPRRWSWSRRRATAAICAVAILTLSTVGFAAAESGPGQPFYQLRLGIETVNLPPAGSQDRLAADLARAEARLADIAGAAAISDWNAAADAADAYRQVVAAIVLPADTTTKAQAAQQLDGQLARLEMLRASSHGSETAALDAAIAALCKVLSIPVPTPPAPAASKPVAHPSDGDRDGGTARPSAAGGDGGDGGDAGGGGGDRGHDRGRSPEPSPSGGDDPGGRGGPSQGPWPSDPGNDHQSPTPKSTQGPRSTGGPTPAPSEQPSMQPSVKR